MRRSQRVEGVDFARGVASLIMIQGHAYDGWVAVEHKASAAYAFTRLLGSLPLPAFLVLAGAAVVLRVDAARQRGEGAAVVRRALVRRGLEVVLWGYAQSAVYALMDGWTGAETFLRADVLHVIGLSIIALAVFGVRGDGAPGLRRLGYAAIALAVVPTALCPWLSPLGASVGAPASYVVGLFVDVPGVTRMPFVPLVSWLALGALAGLALLYARSVAPGHRSGAPDRFFVAVAAVGLVAAAAGSWGTAALLERLGGGLSRAHPAVWLNVIDLGGRGLLVLAAAALMTGRVPEAARRALLRLGRGSLYAYVFHIPFCYGRAGKLLRGRLDMASATVAVIVLMAASWGVVWLRDAWRARAARSSEQPRSS